MFVIRGAITAEKNTREEILQQTKKMLTEIMEKNQLTLSDILSIQFTATKDLDAAYPAVAARELGITDAALFCMQEMYVVGSLPMCIRCSVFCEGDKKQSQAVHVYLEGARVLRPDLT